MLILAGGLVTSTGSGLSVPDWPLSYGRFFPPMRGGVFFEHGHRMIAGTVGFLVAVLALWIHLAEPRRWVRKMASATLGLILLQAFLGGITVLYGLPAEVSVFHACLGQILFCLLAVLSEITSPSWTQSNSPSPEAGSQNSLRVPCLSALAAVLAQLVLGAVFRHTGSLLWLHVAGAWGASFVLAWASVEALNSSGSSFLAAPSKLLLGALTMQILLGAGAAAIRTAAPSYPTVARIVLATAHVGCGALILALAGVLTSRVYRPRFE